MQGKFDEVDWNKLKPLLSHMALDIHKQKQRMGGNFAIAYAVTSREHRDHIRYGYHLATEQKRPQAKMATCIKLPYTQ